METTCPSTSHPWIGGAIFHFQSFAAKNLMFRYVSLFFFQGTNAPRAHAAPGLHHG